MAAPIDRHSDRLIVREWRGDELDGLPRWIGDPLAGRYLTWATLSREDAAVHLEQILEGQHRRPRQRCDARNMRSEKVVKRCAMVKADGEDPNRLVYRLERHHLPLAQG